MRKLLLSLACLFAMTGLVVAAEYTLVKFDKDKKMVTVKDADGKEVMAKITDETKYMTTNKDGEKKEGKMEALEKALSNEKAVGRKFDITIKDDKVTEITSKGRGKKTN